MKFQSDDAAGAVISLVFVFLLSAVLFVVIGYGVDKIVAALIALKSMPSTQMRYNVLIAMLTTFRFEPVVILVGAGLNSWVASLRTLSGEIDLSSMMLAASELIILTMALIALTMFGGLGLESVVNVVNHNPILSAGNLMLFSAVQYIPNVVYGMCFLGLIGAIVQFILTCVQVVDYQQSM
jgi:hypothetical protein